MPGGKNNPLKGPISIFLERDEQLVKELQREIKEALGPDVKKQFLNECKRVNPEGLSLWLQQKFMDDLAFWATAKMRYDVEKFISEGCQNFLSMFKLALRLGHSPLKALDRAWFLFPLTPAKQRVPLEMVLTARDMYRHKLGQLEPIKRKKWRNPAALTMTLKEMLPGITDREAKEWANRKASDIALKYVCKKLELRVDIEALKKYFQNFDTYHDHLTVLATNIRKQRERYPF